MAEGKRSAGILGSRVTIRMLVDKFAGEDGIVRCVSCGNTQTEWHHIVPIECNGKDVFTNIAPLCVECHRAVHYSRAKRSERLAYARSQIKGNGRKRSVPDNYEELLDLYVRCQIGKKELSKRWGVTVTSRKDPTKKIPVDMVHLVDKSWYKDYLRKHGIKSVENHVDYHEPTMPRGKIKSGEYTGTVYYVDGTHKDMYFSSVCDI